MISITMESCESPEKEIYSSETKPGLKKEFHSMETRAEKGSLGFKFLQYWLEREPSPLRLEVRSALPVNTG